MNKHDEKVIDYSVLYRLSCSMANVMDFETAINQFLCDFTEIELISHASIWLKKEENYSFFCSYDTNLQNQNNDKLASINAALVQDAAFEFYSAQHQEYDALKHRNDIDSGTYVIYGLGKVACLKFYVEDLSLFSNKNWERLVPLMEQLANKIEEHSIVKEKEEFYTGTVKENIFLREQFDLFYAVANNLLEGLIVTDTEVRITFVNDKMCRITGFEREELLGQKAYKMLMPKEEWNYIESILALQDKTKLRGFLERKGLKKDGSIWYGLICNAPLFDGEDNFLGLSMTVLNITKRKEIEREKNELLKELSESRNKYKRVVQNLSEGVIMTDLEDRIIFVNKQMCDLTGYTEKELIGQKAYELLLPKSEWQSSEAKLEEREQGVSENYIRLHLKKDGSTWWGSINASPLLDDENQVVGTLAAVMDVSSKVSVENEREALLKELAEKNKDLDDFTYIVSHDLKAPLRSISTLSEWIYDDYASVLGEEGKEQMELLQSRVIRMHDFIESLLAYSRLGHTLVKKETFDLNESLLSIIDSFQPLDNFEVIIKSHLPSITGEKIRLEQVFQNLISNAIKYNDKRKGLIEISHVEADDYFTFTVSDNGKGIESKYFDKIFQIFQTLEARDTYESTGVGLTIVKKIVEAHHGEIMVQSEVGKGTSFIFTIKKF